MFIVLDKDSCLFEVLTSEVLSQIVDLVLYYRDLVLTDNDSLHLNRLDLLVPFVVPDV